MTTTLKTLSPAELQLLAKEVAKAQKATRGNLDVGDTPVDSLVTLHLNGTVRCGEDFEQRHVAKAQPWALLAVALSKLNGVTVASLTREALSADAALITQVKAGAEDAIQAIKEPTRKPTRGKVTTPAAAVLVLAAQPISKADAKEVAA